MINLLYTVLCIFCLCFGFFYGFNLDKEEKIKSPVLKAKEKMEQIKAKKAEEQLEEENSRQLERLNTILDNIDAYDGSSNNQKEV